MSNNLQMTLYLRAALQFVFFSFFGVFLLCVVLLSIGYAMGFFLALLFTYGPNHGTGEISNWKSCFRGTGHERSAGGDPLHDNAEVTDNSSAAETLTRDVRAVLASKQTRPIDGTTHGSAKCDSVASHSWSIASLVVAVAAVLLRVGLSIVEVGEPLPVPAPGPAAVTVTPSGDMPLLFPLTPISQHRTNYMCTGFEFPKDETRWITEIHIESRTETVHHMVLFRMLDAPSTCPFSCFDMVRCHIASQLPRHVTNSAVLSRYATAWGHRTDVRLGYWHGSVQAS